MKELELNPPYQFHHCKVGEVTNTITIKLKKKKKKNISKNNNKTD